MRFSWRFAGIRNKTSGGRFRAAEDSVYFRFDVASVGGVVRRWGDNCSSSVLITGSWFQNFRRFGAIEGFRLFSFFARFFCRGYFKRWDWNLQACCFDNRLWWAGTWSTDGIQNLKQLYVTFQAFIFNTRDSRDSIKQIKHIKNYALYKYLTTRCCASRPWKRAIALVFFMKCWDFLTYIC